MTLSWNVTRWDHKQTNFYLILISKQASKRDLTGMKTNVILPTSLWEVIPFFKCLAFCSIVFVYS